MKLTRRLFIQLTTSAIALFKSTFFQKKEVVAKVAEKTIKPHRSCCYIYNPGLDIDGVRGYTFNHHVNVIKGGVITKIEQSEEHLLHEPVFDYTEYPSKGFDIDVLIFEREGSAIYDAMKNSVMKKNYKDEYTKKGLYRIEEVNEYECPRITHHIIVHPAQEIVMNLIYSNIKSGLVCISEWDNKEVDLKNINPLLTANTLKGRLDRMGLLPKASWRMASVLRAYCLPALNRYIRFANNEIDERLRRVENYKTRQDIQNPDTPFFMSRLDTYTKNLIRLTGRNDVISSERKQDDRQTIVEVMATQEYQDYVELNNKPKSDGWIGEGGPFAKPDDYKI